MNLISSYNPDGSYIGTSAGLYFPRRSYIGKLPLSLYRIKNKIMCIKNAEEIEVTSPMTVYKVVIRITDESDTDIEQKWMTPFKGYMLDSDIVEGKKPYVAYHYNYNPLYFTLSDSSDDVVSMEINDGYIHTYGNIKDVAAEYFYYYHKSFFRYKIEVYECEIPVDNGEYTHYCWRGLFDNYDSVASRKIIFKRKLEDSELEHNKPF